MRKIIVVILNLVLGFTVAHALGEYPITITGSTPASGESISSFDNITLHFDFSKFYESPDIDENGNWGVCTSATDGIREIQLFKGSPDNGEVLSTLCESISYTSDKLVPGTDFQFSFPGQAIEPGQLYTIKITYGFFASEPGVNNKKARQISRTDYDENPFFIEFIGTNNDANLNFSAIYPQKDSSLNSASEFKISFAEPIAIASSSPISNVRLLKDGEIIANPIDIAVLDAEPETAIIYFDNVLLYKGNSYSLIIDGGVFSNQDNSIILNNDLEFQYFGDSWNYFSLKRGLYPADGAEVIEIGNVNIPFNFPEGYGFKTTSSGPVEINADLYVGGLDGEKIGSYVFEASDADATILVGSVSTPLDAGQSYTLIVPKEQVVARNLTGIGSIEGWTNDDVVINLTTPSADAIDVVEINGEIPSQAESIDNVTLSVSPYKYKELDYDVVSCDSPVIKLFEDEEEISSYPLELAKVENSTVIQTKEVLNISLAKGKTYRLVLPAGTVAPDHNFLGKYAANKELSFTIEGMATGELKAEFTSNIAEGQTASHLGVVSIYTANPVAAVEGAALELRNGEEVKTAPVRVSVENGYSHIYADFSDADHKALALERATEYTVVLPQGSVTDASNESLINNEYSFSISGLEKEAEPIVPEYVSVDFMIDNYASTSYRMVKGEPSTIKINATDEWYLKSLTLNGEDVIENVSEEGFYTLPALEADAELAAEFSYFEDLEMTEVSGIGSIENGNRNVSVYNDGNVIVIENLEAGDNVAVYTVNGMVIKSFVAGKDIMYIDAPVGQVYIIRVNNGAVKLQH